MRSKIWTYIKNQTCDPVTGRENSQKSREMLWETMRNGATDLHTHSNASDGKTSPPQLIQEVLNHRLKSFALVDHDTTSGIEAVSMVYEKLTQLGMELPDFIPGVEISCELEGQEVHLLGYYPTGTIRCLDGFLEERRQDREKRNRKMCELAEANGMPIDYDELATEGGGTIGRVHMAQLLIRKGYVSSVDDAFNRFLSEGQPLYVERTLPSAADAIHQIVMTGGCAVLAHPAIYKDWFRGPKPHGSTSLHRKLSLLKEGGLAGVEVLHGETSFAESELIAQVTAELDLVPTAGSDYHGSHKPNVRLRNDRDEGYDILVRYFPELRSRN